MNNDGLFGGVNDLKYLFLDNIKEPFDNELLIKIQGASISKKKEYVSIGEKSFGPVKAITPDYGRKYAIFFKSYIAYFVQNESFYLHYEHEEWVGGLICIYNKSNYLDYIKQNTVAEYILDEEIKHYSVNCSNHIIHIASICDPQITRI
ncbi:hypothetical protein [Mucilaginibacter sp.]|uniref:hypothetical protein n=1 Tax=Mucilaginibacter sp. TaxID=1882438 RepID=UPI00263112A4|nr:hypothetical protein [Mucilaginibacter sp.]MDB4921505.1 hypothetical protein [Mucilaginibacter sp.]